MELREDTLAREAFNLALKLKPNDPEVLNNYGWFLCLRNDSARGLELMEKATHDTLYPTPEKAYLSAGLCLRRLGRNQEAENYLRRAVQIRPELIGGLYHLAAIHFERGATNEPEHFLVRYMPLATPTHNPLGLGGRI